MEILLFFNSLISLVSCDLSQWCHCCRDSNILLFCFIFLWAFKWIFCYFMLLEQLLACCWGNRKKIIFSFLFHLFNIFCVFRFFFSYICFYLFVVLFLIFFLLIFLLSFSFTIFLFNFFFFLLISFFISVFFFLFLFPPSWCG